MKATTLRLYGGDVFKMNISKIIALQSVKHP